MGQIISLYIKNCPFPNKWSRMAAMFHKVPPSLISAPIASVLHRRDLTIRINPARVTHHCDGRWSVTSGQIDQCTGPRPLRETMKGLTKLREPFLMDDDTYPELKNIHEEPRAVLLTDFIQKTERLRQTRWFAKLSAELARTGIARHKKIVMTSEAEILDFLENYVLRLVQTMEDQGYVEKRGVETGYARITARGKLTKAGSGWHRFVTARAVGVTSMPLMVWQVHRDWLQSEIERTGMPPLKALRRGIARVAAAHR